jgi:hypothetical protein
MARKLYLAAVWLHCAALIAYPFLLMGAMFLFDAPGSTGNPYTVGFFLASVLYPVPVLAAALLAWLRRKRQDTAIFRNLLLLSLVSPAAMALFAGDLPPLTGSIC